MIEIYLTGEVFYRTDIKLEKIMILLEDDMVKQDTYIPIILDDGTKAYFKKGAVVGVNEVPEEELIG